MDLKCTICLEQVPCGHGSRSTAKLQCGHEFHLACIGSSFNAKGVMQCPNCRNIENDSWLFGRRYAPSSSNPVPALDSGGDYSTSDSSTDSSSSDTSSSSDSSADSGSSRYSSTDSSSIDNSSSRDSSTDSGSSGDSSSSDFSGDSNSSGNSSTDSGLSWDSPADSGSSRESSSDSSTDSGLNQDSSTGLSGDSSTDSCNQDSVQVVAPPLRYDVPFIFGKEMVEMV